jgi:hypothetical protein
MVVPRKAWISFLLVCGLALPILAGVNLVWELSGVRTHPWHLEAYLGSILAQCRTGPGAFGFRRDYARLEARAEQTSLSLFLIDHKFWLQRDYSPALSSMLSILLDTQLLKQEIVQREKEEQQKAKAFIATLKQELGAGNGNTKLWSQFNRNSIEQNRARSLLAQAEFLNARGEYESALINALRAWSSWQRHSQSSDQEFARFDDPKLRNKWDKQAAELVGWTKETGRRAILVDKLAHRCILLNKGKIEKSYVANLGRNWQRQKAQERDASTPEGEYNIKGLKSFGKYGRALLLDYPNNSDRQRFIALKRTGAIPARARIGGNIEIHGGGRVDSDWTEGCVSLNDGDMLELYAHAYPGMPVSIVGSSRYMPIVRGGANVSD